jgi:hypothetical protein
VKKSKIREYYYILAGGRNLTIIENAVFWGAE